jgi:hypothetical protein
MFNFEAWQQSADSKYNCALNIGDNPADPYSHNSYFSCETPHIFAAYLLEVDEAALDTTTLKRHLQFAFGFLEQRKHRYHEWVKMQLTLCQDGIGLRQAMHRFEALGRDTAARLSRDPRSQIFDVLCSDYRRFLRTSQQVDAMIRVEAPEGGGDMAILEHHCLAVCMADSFAAFDTPATLIDAMKLHVTNLVQDINELGEKLVDATMGFEDEADGWKAGLAPDMAIDEVLLVAAAKLQPLRGSVIKGLIEKLEEASVK